MGQLTLSAARDDERHSETLTGPSRVVFWRSESRSSRAPATFQEFQPPEGVPPRRLRNARLEPAPHGCRARCLPPGASTLLPSQAGRRAVEAQQVRRGGEAFVFVLRVRVHLA